MTSITMKRAILAASLALNLLCLAAGGAWVAQKGGLRYLAEQFGLVRPVAPLRAFQEEQIDEFRAWPNGEGEIVFAGDSITNSVPWHEAFTPIRNRGVGGETSDGLLRRFDEITASSPTQIFLNIGTNDLSRGFAVSDILANVREMVALAGDDTQVFVISVLPINLKFNDRSLHRLKHEALPGLNDGLRAIAAETGALFIDLWPDFADADGQLRKELTSDGLHLTAAGKILYAEKIRPYVVMRQGEENHRAGK